MRNGQEPDQAKPQRGRARSQVEAETKPEVPTEGIITGDAKVKGHLEVTPSNESTKSEVNQMGEN